MFEQRRSLWSIVACSAIQNATTLVLTWHVFKLAYGTYRVAVFFNKARGKLVKVVCPPTPFAPLDAGWIELVEK
jgi:hypothetical protein